MLQTDIESYPSKVTVQKAEYQVVLYIGMAYPS